MSDYKCPNCGYTAIEDETNPGEVVTRSAPTVAAESGVVAVPQMPPATDPDAQPVTTKAVGPIEVTETAA